MKFVMLLVITRINDIKIVNLIIDSLHYFLLLITFVLMGLIYPRELKNVRILNLNRSKNWIVMKRVAVQNF